MLSGDENETKPVKKSAPRKGKTEQQGNRAERRKQKQAAAPEPAVTVEAQADRPSEAPAIVEAPTVAPTPTTVPDDIAPIEDVPLVPAAAAEADVPAFAPIPAVETAPVSYQTIVDAYRNYTRQSFDQTQSFFGRLAGVRSFDKAIELQTEFAKQAYDGFVAETRRLRDLHSQLARQRLQDWEGLVTRMIGPR